MSGCNGQPVNLQDRFTTKLGITLDKQDLLGECFVPAELWPSQRLRNGTAAVSEALSAMLGSASPGETITLHRLPSEINTAQTCSTVVLQLCADSEKESSAVPVALRKKLTAPDAQPEAGSPSPITPAQRGRGANQPPRASPPSMRNSANSQPVPNLLGPSKERPASGKKKSGGGSRGGSETAEKKEFVQKDEAGNAVHLAAVQGLLKGEIVSMKLLRDFYDVIFKETISSCFVNIFNRAHYLLQLEISRISYFFLSFYYSQCFLLLCYLQGSWMINYEMSCKFSLLKFCNSVLCSQATWSRYQY